jgi:hypothetical protein
MTAFIQPEKNKTALHLLCLAAVSVLLSACQSSPVLPPSKASSLPQSQAEENPHPAASAMMENGAKRTPLSEAAQPPLQSSSLPSPTGVSPPRVAQPNVVLRDGSNIPAFRVLINRAQQQIQSAPEDSAEQTRNQAQRMAPQSTAVYAYLSQVALAKRQGSNAEAMARKGLMLTRNPRQQHAFWQLILAAAQLQNNATLATQAQQQMQQLSGQF